MVSTCNLEHVITVPHWVCMPHWPWSHLKHPKLHPCPPSSLVFGYQLSLVPCSYLPSERCSRAHGRPLSATAAAAKISTAALEETLRQNPEAGLGLDHFTLKIMYFSKGSPSMGWGFPSRVTVIYLRICRQECATKTVIFIIAPQENPTKSSA